jgi:hypothetical protein
MSDELMTLQATTGVVANVFLDPESFTQLARVAKAFSTTAIVPEAYRGKPEDCMVAIDMANRLGVSPLMVMQNLYVVKGKPSWSGQACMALVQNCGRFRDVRHVYTGTKGADDRGCYLEAIRISNDEVVTGVEVTMSMAKAEGWISNPKWKNMPELMLAYRAAAFFARVNCPETLMGLHVEGEVEDVKPERRIIDDPLAEDRKGE